MLYLIVIVIKSIIGKYEWSVSITMFYSLLHFIANIYNVR